ncbi:UNVERIFIED_CONTAM: hypothetical protein K2H54_070214 [Gekko kuhli]
MEANKMATGNADTENAVRPVTTEEPALALQNIESTFLDKLSTFMKPYHEHLDTIQKSLTETRGVAETALNNSLVNQSDIQNGYGRHHSGKDYAFGCFPPSKQS